MKTMVPNNKQGKRLRRETDRQRRVTWGFSPMTRRSESAKVYSRKQKHRKDLMSGGVFV